MDVESTNQYDSLGINVATFDHDIHDCGDAHGVKVLASSNDLRVSEEGIFPKPFVGLEFETLDKAYFFYNEYARVVGFSIRRAKNRRSNIDGELLFQRFCCSKEGHRRKRRESDDGTKVKDGVLVKVRRRNVKSIRVGCSAKLDVKRTGNGKWVIQKFDEEHNHDYAHHGEKHLLRSQRRQPNDGSDIDIGSKRMLSYFTGEGGGSEERRKRLERGDVKVILEYFTQMQTENSSFFYAVQVGKVDQMLNFFWADTRSSMDFGYFGDVIYFSTDYGAKYGRPFCPILGVNHHLEPVLFGSAILLNQSEESFIWLLDTFLKSMSGLRPLAIITNEDPALEKAIERVLPGIQHRLCVWHILQDAAKQLSHIYNGQDDFSTELKKCLHESQWIDEFESRWGLLLDKYKLCDNEWFNDMFRKRHKWVPVYSRHIFHADMTVVHRIESISSFFDGFLNDSLPLSEFLKLSEKALAYRREQEINEDFQSHQTRPILKLNIPMEDQAANIYTGAAFKEFHRELCESLNYIVEETARAGTNWEYAVSRWGQNRSFLVNFSSCDNDIHVICNCQNFKFAGFLCRHIFKVFIVRNIMLIPHKYFKKRWTKRAKSGVASSDSSSETGSQTSLSLCYNDLCQLSLNFCAKAAVSIDAFRSAKHDIEMIIRELEKVAEEDMCVTQPDIEQIRSLHLPVEVVNNIGSSNHILTVENQTLSSANQITLPNPTRLGDKRTGFWLRL